MPKKRLSNPNGIVSPQLGADRFKDLESQAVAFGVKPTTLARQLLLFALNELEAGRIELPPDHAISVS